VSDVGSRLSRRGPKPQEAFRSAGTVECLSSSFSGLLIDNKVSFASRNGKGIVILYDFRESLLGCRDESVRLWEMVRLLLDFKRVCYDD